MQAISKCSSTVRCGSLELSSYTHMHVLQELTQTEHSEDSLPDGAVYFLIGVHFKDLITDMETHARSVRPWPQQSIGP